MCTFNGEREVMVCDSAIDAVRKRMEREFRGAVSFTHVDWHGTRVEASPEVDSGRFRELVELGPDVPTL